MSKIDKERKNGTADISDKGNLQKELELRTNFKPTEILNTPTFNRCCNPIRVKKGFSN